MYQSTVKLTSRFLGGAAVRHCWIAVAPWGACTDASKKDFDPDRSGIADGYVVVAHHVPKHMLTFIGCNTAARQMLAPMPS